MGGLTGKQRLRLLWCLIGATVYGIVQTLLYVGASLLVQTFHAGEAGLQLISGLANGASLGIPVLVLLVLGPLQPRRLRLRPPHRWRLAFYLPLYLGASILFNLLGMLVQPLDGGGTQALPAGLWAFLAVIFANCLVPALMEELFFRGALMGVLLPLGSKIAVVAPAILFAVFHAQPSQMLVALLTGLYFGWVARRTGSILPGMVLHFTNNLVAILEMYLDQYASPRLAGGIEVFYLTFCVLLFLALAAACWSSRRLPAGEPPTPGPGLPVLLAQPLFTLFSLALVLAHIFF